jgi:hypothetical protein
MNTPFQMAFEIPRVQDQTEPAGCPTPLDECRFPEQQANALARLESYNKHLYRPNTYLHKWWARRSGTTFRHILKHLVDDPQKRDFYAPGGLTNKIILDPMMGGGTTLHEAIRMGANVIGVDIDPIPVVQARATLSLSSLSHRKAAFQQFFGMLREALSPYYRTICPHCDRSVDVQFCLYALRRRCDCQEVLMLDSLVLRHNHEEDVEICPVCHEVNQGTHHCAGQAERALFEKGTGTCSQCGSAFGDVLDVPFVQRYVPLAVFGRCPRHGAFIKSIGDADMALLKRAEAQVAQAKVDFGDADQFRVPSGPKSDDLLDRGITSFQQLFTARQLLYIQVGQQALKEFSPEDRLWLGLLLSTSLEFNSLLCGYKGAGLRRPGAIRHVFSYHAYTFPYTALENNPVFPEKSSGTLQRLFHGKIERAGKWAMKPVERFLGEDGKPKKVHIPGEVDGGQAVGAWQDLSEGERRFLMLQADAGELDIPKNSVDYVVTDPPYYDSVQYSDLSNFFRVWLRLFLPDEADWQYDPLASAVSEGDAAGREKYGEVLGKIWQMCHRALKEEHGHLIFTFHHWNPEAWAELTLSLKRGGFSLVNYHIVFSENPTSVHIRNLKSLKHDAILILKPEESAQQKSQWSPPEVIHTEDSRSFCGDCAVALGWFLSTEMSEDAIRDKWRQLLEGDADDNR